MKAISYYLLAPLIYLFSILPFRVLYLFSDLMFPLMYYILAYRKKIVLDNLRNSFPEKPEEEIRSISRRFYRHFTDVIFEIIKMRSASPDRISRRISYSNPELLEKFYREGKSVLAMSAHYNCWEWSTICARYTPHRAVVIYKPLSNNYFDRFMKKARQRYGVETIPMRETLRQVISRQKKGDRVLYGLVSDQSPVWEEVQHWTRFLNRPTAAYTGVEKLAHRTGHPVIYYSMRKTGRGRYVIDLVPISEDHTDKSENEITDAFFRMLEDRIRENPEYWLWTHRRWKLNARRTAEMKKGSG